MGVIKEINELIDIGYTRFSGVFTSQEIDTIRTKLQYYAKEGHPGTIVESDGRALRGLHGLHLYDAFFKSLCSHFTLLNVAQSYLGEPCYVHQFKANMKQRMIGQAWPWHQDFTFWNKGDGIVHPKMLSIGILLDDTDMLSGPLCFIPRSHKSGDISDVHLIGEDWNQDLSQNLTYQVGAEKIQVLLDKQKEQYMLGSAGDVIVFDPLLVHCSSSNMSPTDRQILLITYNAVSNTPQNLDLATRRPEFLCARNYQALSPQTVVFSQNK